MSGVDPLSLALDYLIKIDGKSSGKPQGLARRLRSLPSLVMDSGLAMAMLFYAARAGSQDDKKGRYEYEEALKILEGGDGALPDSVYKEGGGYGVALALLVAGIRALGLLSLVTDTGKENPLDLRDLNGVVELIKRIRDRGVELEVETALRLYIESLKRGSEALWGGKQ